MPERRRPWDPQPRGIGEWAVAVVIVGAALVLNVLGGALRKGTRRG
jgi:hypothetical protein